MPRCLPQTRQRPSFTTAWRGQSLRNELLRSPPPKERIARRCARLLGPLVACAALVLSWPGGAQAASFQVDPSTFVLSAAATNGQLAIRNLGDEPVRIQVSAFAWNQTPGGEVDLTPTHDLVFFPSILTIAPHDARNVRISAASEGILTSTTVEKTYRLIVEELAPTAKASLPSSAVRVLIKMSVPVFVQPATLKPVPRVERLAVQSTRATFEVANPGTAHFITRKVRVYATARDGRKLFDETAGGWYVLAHSMRAYDIALPSSPCDSGAKVTVEVETDQGNVVEHLKAACTSASQ
jgi:fimbrial chaperone protein